MSLPISIKCEKAIALDFLPDALDIAGLNIYEGHEKAESISFPSLVIYAEGSAPHPDFPAECGVRVVRLRCKITADSMVTTRSDLNDWRGALELVMTDDIEALQLVLNRPASGPDNRTVTQIHFHYVELSDDPSDRHETEWEEDLVFNVTCELLDD